MKVRAKKQAERPKRSDKRPQEPKGRRKEKPKSDEATKPDRTGPYDDPHRRPA